MVRFPRHFESKPTEFTDELEVEFKRRNDSMPLKLDKWWWLLQRW